jgi:hypothetical protein
MHMSTVAALAGLYEFGLIPSWFGMQLLSAV